MRTSPLAKQLADEDAKRPPPEPTPGNGQASAAPDIPQGPRYEFWRPWYKRLLAKGCARCGGAPQGWIQQQISTPYRFKRFVLWMVNLIPRATSFVLTVTSKRVQSEQYAERQAACGACPAALIQLRVVRSTVRETSYCSACACPKWKLSQNAVRNWRSRWACPLRRHLGSDANARLVEYLRAKTEQPHAEGDGEGDDGDA